MTIRGLGADDGRQLPASQDSLSELVVLEQRLAFSKRKLIDRRGGKALAHIIPRISARRREIVRVLRAGIIPIISRTAGAVIKGVTSGVSGEDTEPFTEAPLDLPLKTLIVPANEGEVTFRAPYWGTGWRNRMLPVPGVP